MAEPIIIEGPDGNEYEFPQGTDEATIKGAMAKQFPKGWASTATGTPDFRAMPSGGTPSYGQYQKPMSKEERLARNAANRRLTFEEQKISDAGNETSGLEAAGIGTLNAGTMGNYAGIMSSHMQASAERRRSPMYGNPLLEYAQDKVGDFLNPGNESQKQRESTETDWQARQGTAAMEHPGAYLGGELAGYLAPSTAAWKGGTAAMRALPFADDIARIAGKTRLGAYGGRLLAGGMAMTADSALMGATVGASDEAALSAAQGQPIDMTPMDRLKIGGQYATASLPLKTPLGEIPLPVNFLAPVAGSAVMRGSNKLLKGYGVPDEIAAKVYNTHGRTPYGGSAATSIAQTGRTLTGTVTPGNMRGFKGIENALTDALEGVEINGRPITRRQIRDRIATGFDNIRQGIPSLDEPGMDLARLIEREFSNDAPQIQETIRRFLLKVGLDSTAGRTVVQNATNEIRGQQRDTLSNEVNRLGDQPKQEVKSILQDNRNLIQTEGYGKALGALDINSPGQQEALDILSRGAEYKSLLGEAAQNAGMPVDDFVLQNPLRALHEVRSKLLKRQRELWGSGNPDFDLEDLTEQMASILDANVPGYNQLRNMYRSEAQAGERLGTTRGPEAGTSGEGVYDPGFGEKMLSPNNTSREEGRQTFKQIFDAMDPKSQRAAAISVRDRILQDLDKASAEGIEQRYQSAAKMQALRTEGGLKMLEEVFGEEGRAISKRVREFVDANQYARDIDPAFNSQTINKQTAMETGDIPFASSFGRATNKAGGSLGDSAAADLALMAFGGPPVLSLIGAGRKSIQRWQLPRHSTRVGIAETLLTRPGQGARAVNAPPPITRLTPNDLPRRGVNALASNTSGTARSGFTTDLAASAAGSVGGSVYGSQNDLNGDGVIDERDAQMGALGGMAAGFAGSRGIKAANNIGRATEGAAREFRVRPGESGTFNVETRAGGQRWQRDGYPFASRAEAEADIARVQGGQPAAREVDNAVTAVLTAKTPQQFWDNIRTIPEGPQRDQTMQMVMKRAKGPEERGKVLDMFMGAASDWGERERIARQLLRDSPTDWQSLRYAWPGSDDPAERLIDGVPAILELVQQEAPGLTQTVLRTPSPVAQALRETTQDLTGLMDEMQPRLATDGGKPVPSAQNAAPEAPGGQVVPFKKPPNASGVAPMLRYDAANALVGAGVGSTYPDLNHDGKITMQERLIGAGIGAAGAVAGTRIGTEGNYFSRSGAGGRKPPKLPKLKSDVPLGTPPKGPNPKLGQGNIIREGYQGKGNPRLPKGPMTQGQLAARKKRETVLPLLEQGMSNEAVRKKTGIPTFTYQGKTVLLPDFMKDTKSDTITELFYKEMSKPFEQRKRWVQDIIRATADSEETALAAQRRWDEKNPLILGTDRTPMVKPGQLNPSDLPKRK